MKSTKRSDARRLALFGLLALLPLAIWACDAGDAPGPPTGPATVYNPAMDQTGATITAQASSSTVNAGTTFGISATFKDANGRPVEGAPLGVWPEAGDRSAPYFSYATNPTLTDANGQASMHIYVVPTCPSDSFTFVVATHPGLDGPFARALVHVVVRGSGVPIPPGGVTVSTPSTPTGNVALFVGEAETYTTGGASCNNNDTVEYELSATDQTATGWSTTPSATFTWATAGAKSVTARARCQNSPTVVSGASPALAVTVTGVVATQPTVSGPAALATSTLGTFTAAGSTCSNGETVQYQFTATGTPGQVSPSAWMAVGSTQFSWATAGIKTVSAKARCAVTTNSESPQSADHSVTVGP